jgi:CRISPR/Cas system-associated endoribonuclease Cas2
MDEDVIQIYKNKTKAMIKKEKIGQENDPKKV